MQKISLLILSISLYIVNLQSMHKRPFEFKEYLDFASLTLEERKEVQESTIFQTTFGVFKSLPIMDRAILLSRIVNEIKEDWTFANMTAASFREDLADAGIINGKNCTFTRPGIIQRIIFNKCLMDNLLEINSEKFYQESEEGDVDFVSLSDEKKKEVHESAIFQTTFGMLKSLPGTSCTTLLSRIAAVMNAYGALGYFKVARFHEAFTEAGIIDKTNCTFKRPDIVQKIIFNKALMDNLLDTNLEKLLVDSEKRKKIKLK